MGSTVRRRPHTGTARARPSARQRCERGPGTRLTFGPRVTTGKVAYTGLHGRPSAAHAHPDAHRELTSAIISASMWGRVWSDFAAGEPLGLMTSPLSSRVRRTHYPPAATL